MKKVFIALQVPWELKLKILDLTHQRTMEGVEGVTQKRIVTELIERGLNTLNQKNKKEVNYED